MTINWFNFDSNNFNTIFNIPADASRGQKAIDIVNRAISDWNAVLANFNYAEDSDSDPNNNLNNTFQLTITATSLAAGTRGNALVASNQFAAGGKPKAATVNIDNDGGGNGWFLDTTPRDDAEFSAIESAFSANFVDVNSTFPAFGLFRDDLYRTVVHEIGHALGQAPFAGSAIAGMLSNLYNSNGSTIKDGYNASSVLKRFQSTRSNPTFGVTATYTDGHIYEGLSGVDPTIAYLSTTGTSGVNPVAFQSHPNELMNPGRSVPQDNETTRQFISDLDAKILADAYGYTVTLPSALNNAFVSLDEQTGTLLVQGRPNAQNDTINIFSNFANIVTEVNGHFEVVPGHLVQRIIIAKNGGADTVTVTGNHPVTGGALAGMYAEVQYVVSSNQDLADAGVAIRDGIVDHSSTIPGAQVSLRSAILDALAPAASSPTTFSYIYVPRGAFTLSAPTVGVDDGVGEGDLDITSGNYVTIIGSGPGVTLINGGAGGTINERVFDVGSGGTLNLERLTVTGGNSTAPGEYGGAIMVRNAGGALLNQVAVTKNSSTAGAGGIWNSGYLSITNSVIADNTVTQTVAAGAPDWHTGGINSVGTLIMSNTIVANNTADNTNSLGRDIVATAPVTGGGYNRIESANSVVVSAYNNTTNAATGGIGNYFGSVSAGRIVTNIADVWYDDPRATALRNIMFAANQSTSINDEIWLPGWRFMLTRNRQGAEWPGPSQGVIYGDIDIADTLTIRGVDGSTQFGLRDSAVADRVFELLGDYNSDGTVDVADYTVWRDTLGSTTDLRADGNDDGIVNQWDYTVWNHPAIFGNTLHLYGVTSYGGAQLT